MTHSQAQRASEEPVESSESAIDPSLRRVLELARWAPSPDNVQPWRFEVTSPRSLIVHGHAEKELGIYDLLGRGGQIAMGALLETLEAAASREGWTLSAQRLADSRDSHPSFRIEFSPTQAPVSPLAEFIERRSTQRRPMGSTALTAGQKAELEAHAAAVAPGFRIAWFEGADRARVARLLFKSAHIRLTSESAYHVHTRIIQWRARYSEDRIPDRAIGLDPLTTRFMEWAMGSWRRVSFMNRWFAGTLAPRLQLDYLPGRACAAHAVLLCAEEPLTVDHQVAAGRALQRLWLAATGMGLQMQPEMTPILFSEYVRKGVDFSPVPHHAQTAREVARRLEAMLGPERPMSRTVCMLRLGGGRDPSSRSLRLPLNRLLRRG